MLVILLVLFDVNDLSDGILFRLLMLLRLFVVFWLLFCVVFLMRFLIWVWVVVGSSMIINSVVVVVVWVRWGFMCRFFKMVWGLFIL